MPLPLRADTTLPVAKSQAVGTRTRPAVSTLELLETAPTQELLQQWDGLADACGASPWTRPGWVLPWWRHFATGSPALLVLRAGDTRLRGVLPLQRAGDHLASATNWHTPEYDVLAEDDAARTALLTAALERCSGRLTLDFVDEAQAHELADLASRLGARSRVQVLEVSPYLLLEPGWEASVDRHVLAEVRRRERRLRERGQLAFTVHDGKDGLDALLVEGFRVEASGWKGRSGSAIACSPATEAFYRAVSSWAADRGLLRLCFLRLDGRALAFDLSIESDGVHSLLKTGFDEHERAAGPGKLLRAQVLRDCEGRGVRSYEFLGNDQAWKQEWTSAQRTRYRVVAFPRGPRGARAYALHGLLRPAAVRAGGQVKRSASSGLVTVRRRLSRAPR